jgi:hypothetical protein
MDGKYDQIEISKILGVPNDPRKPFTDLVTKIAEVEYADPEDNVYYFDVLLETDKVLAITSTGELTTENVSPDSPALFTFIDIASPEYWVKITELAKAKEATLARKLKTINRALNAYENRYMITLADGAASTASHEHILQSNRTRFSYDDLIYMIQDVIDYGDEYVLTVGATVDTDIKLWDWNDNKYHSLKEAFEDLGIDRIRVSNTVTIDDSPTAVLNTNTAYLIAKQTEVGLPFLFVRKRLNDIDLLGATIMQNGERPERLVFASPNPVAVNVSGTSKRYLAVGLTGYEEVVCACVNPYAVSEFIRS